MFKGKKPIRFRWPKLKEGELRVFWGREADGIPELLYATQGEYEMKYDAILLINAFEHKKPDPFARPLFSKMFPSLVEELRQRGYDITTLKFSIRKQGEDYEY